MTYFIYSPNSARLVAQTQDPKTAGEYQLQGYLIETE